MLKSHQRGDLTPAETKFDYLRFAKVLYEERNGAFDSSHSARRMEALYYHGVTRTKAGRIKVGR